MTPADIGAMEVPPPSSEEITQAVVMFVQDDTLAGRVLVRPDEEPWRLVPVDTPV